MAQTNRGDTKPLERELGRAGQPGITATDLLDDDHNRVLQMFNQYENTKSDASPEEKRQLARTICRELKIHTRIEEEIWYPQLRSRADVDDRVDEALAEHDRAKELIKEIEAASTHDAEFDYWIKALDDEVRHHIHEERDGLFDVAEIADCNTAEMARALLARKRELESEIH